MRDECLRVVNPGALGVGDGERASAPAGYSAETLGSRRGRAAYARVWRTWREARATVCAEGQAASLFQHLLRTVLPSDPITNAPFRRTGGGFLVSKESEYLVRNGVISYQLSLSQNFVSFCGMTHQRPLVHCATMATTPAPVSARLASRGDPRRSARCAAERDAGHGRASRASPSPETLGGRRHAILTSGATVSGLLFPREALAYGLGKAPPASGNSSRRTEEEIRRELFTS